jgi:hypothetical protein
MYQRPHQRSPRAADKPYGFLRLPFDHDVDAVRAEITAADLPWLDSQWKWHLGTRFCILRGGPPTGRPGDRLTNGSGVDAPALDRLPRTHALLDAAFPVPVALAWLGESPPGARIHLHVDNTRHWDEHHRVHVPLVTNPTARLALAGRFQHFAPGHAWAFDNSRPHGAANDGPPRLHLIVDLPDLPAVRRWLAAGEPVEGEPDRALWAELATDPLTRLTLTQRADPELMARLRAQ